MATLLSYTATFEQTGLANAAVARYRFNEGSGTTAQDSIGALDGSYQTGAAPGVAGSIGDGAASFDGSSGFVLVDTVSNPISNEPLLLADGAFEMWFTLDDLSQPQTLFAKDSAGRGTGGQVAAIVNTNGRLTFALSDDTTVFFAQSANGEVEAGTPMHLVANFGSGGMHAFVNGVEVVSDVYTGGLDAGLGNSEQLVIGAGNGTSTSGTIDNVNQFVGGTIDEFAIYDRALAGGEIQQLFDGGTFGTVVVGTAGADALIGGSDSEVLRGLGGADLIQGGQGDDALIGGDGDDQLRGGAGDDALDGEAGSDLLVGGAGDDLLNGGLGRDTLRGGSGSDTFQIDDVNHGVDRILDFAAGAGGDVLDLNAVIDFGAGDDVAEFVRLDSVNGNTKVAVDTDGGGDKFTAVVNLVGATGLDVGTLVADGNLQLT